MNFCPHAKLIRNTVILESSVVFRALYQLRNAKLPVKMGSSFIYETNKLIIKKHFSTCINWMGHGECVKLLTGVHCGVINFNSSRHNLFLSNFVKMYLKF